MDENTLRELRDAVALESPDAMSEPLARTFHSLAFSILKMRWIQMTLIRY